MANVKLPKYDTRISGKKIRRRVRGLSLPEPKLMICAIAVGVRFSGTT